MIFYGWSHISKRYHVFAEPVRHAWAKTLSGEERWVDEWSDTPPPLASCPACSGAVARLLWEQARRSRLAASA